MDMTVSQFFGYIAIIACPLVLTFFIGFYFGYSRSEDDYLSDRSGATPKKDTFCTKISKILGLS